MQANNLPTINNLLRKGGALEIFIFIALQCSLTPIIKPN